ncbi:hypothetical protein Esti_005134 [Eimeria stiedai]
MFQDAEAAGRRVDLTDSYRLFCGLKRIQQHMQKAAKEKEVHFHTLTPIGAAAAPRGAAFAAAALAASPASSSCSLAAAPAPPLAAAAPAAAFCWLSRLRKKGASAEALEAKAAALEEELGAVSLDYISFLQQLGDFTRIPRHLKYRQPDYLHFLTETENYLEGFFFRRYPLTHFEQVAANIKENFKKQYEADLVSGWEEKTHQNPLYCKVTDRLFASSGTLAAHQQGAKYKKKLLHFSALSAEAFAAATQESEETDRNLAFLEFRIKAYAEMLHESINARPLRHTIAYHQKQQSINADEAEDPEEGESSNDEAAAGEEEESEAEEEGPVYNPLNLPLGFDGRPIPYWLYKLHGLGQEFKCEICGNFSYWGRRAFERHFSEWRHSFGMRCLKIPNTTHFKEITKIEDAIMLYEKLKKQAEGHSFKQDQELECEDADGNRGHQGKEVSSLLLSNEDPTIADASGFRLSVFTAAPKRQGGPNRAAVYAPQQLCYASVRAAAASVAAAAVVAAASAAMTAMTAAAVAAGLLSHFLCP